MQNRGILMINVTTQTTRIAAFAVLATTLGLMAFVTFPAAEASLLKKVNVKITNNTVKILNVEIKVKDVLNNNKIVYVQNVNILSGNTITVTAPIVIQGNAINVCLQVLNAFSWQQCKAIAFGDTDVKTVAFTINN
jgi:hypothetical protein